MRKKTQADKEYYKRNFSSLHTEHRVDRRQREKELHPDQDFESPYCWQPIVDSLIARAAEAAAIDDLFWGDVIRRPEKVYYIPGHPDYQKIKRLQRKEIFMTLHSLIANGGKVVVIGGRMNPLWHRFNNDPRIEFWTGDRSEIERHFPKGGRDSLPTNTHGIIMSRFVSHSVVSKILDEARRRHMTVMGPKNDGEVTRLLEEIMTQPVPETPTSSPASPPPKEETPKTLRPPLKGELTEYVQKYDNASKSIKEMSVIIAEKMNAAGIRSISSSVQNSIGNFRRTAGVYAKQQEKTTPAPQPPPGIPALPKPLPPPPPPPSAPPLSPPDDGTLALLQMIGDLQAGLSLLQDKVKQMHEQNIEYRQLEAKLGELGFIRK